MNRVTAIAIILATAPVAAAPAAAESASLADGRAVYNFRCYFCHGYSGDARTLAATFLKPPPADFTSRDPADLTPTAIAAAVRHGRPGTAMKSFSQTLSDAEIANVAQFVHREFVVAKAGNTRYHTSENGWPNHIRYRAAFPFATGEITLSRPWESLSAAEAEGKRLYLASCVSCHDRGALAHDDVAWDARPLSFPRNNFSLATPTVDAVSSASPYAKHGRPPKPRRLSASELLGQRLFQANCSFCHAADGSGRNWIGQFLEPHPRNLRDPEFMTTMTREQLQQRIAAGMPGSSMPAWGNVLSRREIRAVVDYVGRAFHHLPPWRQPPS